MQLNTKEEAVQAVVDALESHAANEKFIVAMCSIRNNQITPVQLVEWKWPVDDRHAFVGHLALHFFEMLRNKEPERPREPLPRRKLKVMRDKPEPLTAEERKLVEKAMGIGEETNDEVAEENREPLADAESQPGGPTLSIMDSGDAGSGSKAEEDAAEDQEGEAADR